MSRQMQTRLMTDAYNLRLPDGMRDKIKVQAAKNRRSMNAEIIMALEKAIEEPETA